MKTKIFIFLVTLPLCISILSFDLFPESVFTKDGSIYNGTIISDSAGSITIRLVDGKIKAIGRYKILRIIYADLYMGKVFVQKTDGEVITAFMVDENQDTYTFRKKLYEPKEFTVKRDDVLFIARSNPTGLKGEPETEEISLKWNPPYNPVKGYKVYIKTKKREKYKLAGETMWKNYTISGLKSNTLHYVIVTAIDKEGMESLPSNEVEVTTLNIKPFPPGNIRIEKKNSGNKLDVMFKWDEAKDPDGKIKSYRIYKYMDNQYQPAGKTSKLSYQLTGLSPEKKYTFAIRSIDDKGDESPDSFIIRTHSMMNAMLRGCYLFPMRDYAKLAGPGYGSLLNVSMDNLLFNNTLTGIEAGYFRFKGKETVDSATMIPFMLSPGYRLYIIPNLSLEAKLSFGITYNTLTYDPDGHIIGEAPKYTSKSQVEPIVMPGFSCTYFIRNSYMINLGADYGAVFESGLIVDFLSFYGGFGYSF